MHMQQLMACKACDQLDSADDLLHGVVVQSCLHGHADHASGRQPDTPEPVYHSRR